MRRPEKRQILFICILVGFLVYGLIGYGLSLTITKPIQGEPFSFTLSEKMPLQDRESYPVPLPLWQVNESNGVFAEIVAGKDLYRVLTKSWGSIWNALCSHPHDKDSEDISLHLIDYPDTVFKFVSCQTYQLLDIPPPHSLVSL
jgi:hypothetical protein